MKQEYSQLSDAELVTQTLAGEKACFAELIDRYAGVLSAIAFPWLRNSEDACDLVQQVFFIAYRDLQRLSNPEKFGFWVRGIARNVARKVLTQREQKRVLLDRMPRSGKVAEPPALLEDQERTKEIWRILQQLSKDAYEIVILHYFRGKKLETISTLTGKPLGSIKRILSNARTLLRKELIEMAREEFEEYMLTESQRDCLAKIGEFPHSEPKVTVTKLEESAPEVCAIGVGNVELRPGAEINYADYFHLGGKLKSVTHESVSGPVQVNEKSGFNVDGMTFDADGKHTWAFQVCYHVSDNSYLLCGSKSGQEIDSLSLRPPEDNQWDPTATQYKSLLIKPGVRIDPDGAQQGCIVENELYELKIGKRLFKCIKRIYGGAKQTFRYSAEPLAALASEEYFLQDGRLLLFRRYLGQGASSENPDRENTEWSYERLADAGVPQLQVFGQTYYLWFDRMSEYAIRG